MRYTHCKESWLDLPSPLWTVTADLSLLSLIHRYAWKWWSGSPAGRSGWAKHGPWKWVLHIYKAWWSLTCFFFIGTSSEGVWPQSVPTGRKCVRGPWPGLALMSIHICIDINSPFAHFQSSKEMAPSKETFPSSKETSPYVQQRNSSIQKWDIPIYSKRQPFHISS